MRSSILSGWIWLTLLFCWNACASNWILAAPPTTAPVEGLRENPSNYHALINATIVLEPGRIVEQGTLVIRDGSIISVGTGIPAPPGAIVHDLTGKHVYPGLMDSYSETSVTLQPTSARHWNSLITPELVVSEHYGADSAVNAKLRRQGIVCRLLAPDAGILKGTSCIVSASDLGGSQSVWKEKVAQHVRLGIPRGRGPRGYPSSPMGAVALARQTFLDAEWYPKAWNAFLGNQTLPRPERNLALESLADSLSRRDRFIIDGINELYLLRADDFAREFSLNSILRGSGQEYQRLEAVRATGRSLIIPVSFAEPPAVDSPEAVRTADLGDLLHWELAPENPARLHAAGVQFALSTADLNDVGEFLSKVRVAVQRGLPADAALAALTTVPATLFGISDRFGTIASGKSASFFVTDGDLFKKETKIQETWVDGQRYPMEGTDTLDVRGTWEATITSPNKEVATYKIQIQSEPRLKGELLVPGPEDKVEKVAFAKLSLSDRVLAGSLPGKSLGQEGIVQFSGTIIETEEASLRLDGRLAWPDGTISIVSAVRLSQEVSEKEEPGKKVEGDQPKDQKEESKQDPEQDESNQPESPPPTDDQPAEQPKTDEPEKADKSEESDKTERVVDTQTEETQTEETQAEETQPAETKSADEAKADPSEEPQKTEKADEAEKPTPVTFALTYPLGAFGRAESPPQPPVLVFQNVTIWTCSDAGVIEGGTVIVQAGKITGVGKDLPIPEGAELIDGTGKHLTPGMIDCHSHTASDGGINESSQAITAEVRVGDFVNCDDIDIYRQLAGGITTINILHGSANPIGGQNQVIKLRWGELYDSMRFREAPPGIKFALGENVKRSNRPETASERYPASRMGVEQLIRDAFQAAKDYQQQWAVWQRDHQTLPPRKDLELEALAEILRGERWVHCHSYRQDEILALLRTCEEFGIRIATLQHILEGYKVADAMARHGAMGSSFSDWWAYKVEVYDAIPYNGALMHQAGIVVSFNSDDRELARHMNHEAAKAIRYGNIEPEEALKFVTLNPAKQLRIDEYVGSIEEGKHADMVLWSGPPLSIPTRCEQTWIDGRRYFDIQEDAEMRETARVQRAALVQKVLASGETPRSRSERSQPEESLWPLEDEFCRARELR